MPALEELAKPASSGWESGAWALDFIGSWEWTIPGGTSEIQRTIIGERGLGLPEAGGALMPADSAEVRDELRAVARDLLGTSAPEGAAADWRLLASAGWLGLEVPEGLDGAGVTFGEVAVIAEEMGRATARCAYLGAVVLGVGTLTLLEPGPGRDELLRLTASGDTVPAAALVPGDDDADQADRAVPPFVIGDSPSGRRLRGRAAFVPDALAADRLLLLAADPAGIPVIVDVDPRAPGITRTAQPVLDATRRLGLITAEDVPVSEDCVWRFGGDPAVASGLLFDRAATAVACDSLGLSEAMLDATVSYARVREQFGRPIGSFQAVKHACADMFVQVRVMRELVAEAVERLADPGAGRPAADPAGVSAAASMAKSYAGATAVEVAGKAMQLHGGMGYTWESGIHCYLKRALLNRALFGSPGAHRRRLARRYG